MLCFSWVQYKKIHTKYVKSVSLCSRGYADGTIKWRENYMHGGFRYLKSFAGRLDVHHVLLEAGIATGKDSAGIGEAWSGGGSQHPPERPGGARKVVAAPLRQGLGADKYFSRRHGRRDHNWQWNMDDSPWARSLMAKGKLM